jgi:hypothetical protein
LIPRTPDNRDKNFSEVYGVEIPKAKSRKVSMADSVKIRRNQLDRGACGPHAVCFCVEKLCADLGIEVNLSPLFVYWVTRYLMGTLSEDSGVNNRDLAKAVTGYGVCIEDLWLYAGSMFEKPSRTAFQEAMHRQLKLGGYGWAKNVDEARGVLDILGKPLVMAIPIYESAQSDEVARTGIIPMPNTKTERLLGGHDIAETGYNDDMGDGHLEFVNSWGADWGRNGVGYLPYGYPIYEHMAVKADECGVDDPAAGIGRWETMMRKLRGMA